jgi:prepilin-type N-terminal cleavage/methylation domain-containing protein
LKYKFNITIKPKGFTLVELIISIGIVAIISSTILQLFITAGNLNRKAYDIDKCVMLSETIIEQFKSGNKPIDVKNIDILKNAFYSGNDNSFKLSLYLDGKWKEISKEVTPSEVAANIAATYILKVMVKPNANKGTYNISVTVIKNKFGYLEKNTNTNFYIINAIKYFSAARMD